MGCAQPKFTLAIGSPLAQTIVAVPVRRLIAEVGDGREQIKIWASMEDIEDLLIGNGVGGAPLGFRLPLGTVGFNSKHNKNQPNPEKKSHIQNYTIPGTQVFLSLDSYDFDYMCICWDMGLNNSFYFGRQFI